MLTLNYMNLYCFSHSSQRKKGGKNEIWNGVSVSVSDILYTFILFDANKDGRISRQELKEAAFLIGLNPTEKEIKAWWKLADKNSEYLISKVTPQICYIKVFRRLFLAYIAKLRTKKKIGGKGANWW